MKNIINFIRSTKWVSRILIGIWLFLCTIFTLAFLIGSSHENMDSDVAALLTIYVLFSVMFLIPAITITQAQNAASNIEKIEYSDKSYWIMLFLSVFLGSMGAHRFYAGKKITGIIYLFTLGGFTIGWIVDVILVVVGKFPDKNGRVIRLPARKKANQNAIHDFTKPCENLENIKEEKGVQASAKQEVKNQIVNENKQSMLFSDMVVTGQEEKKQPIPIRKTTLDTSETSSFGVRFETEIQEQENEQDFTMSDIDLMDLAPLSDLDKCTDKVEETVEFVPFMRYWPTYSDMNKRQRAWYLYWRTQVENSNYLDTDLSYIFVYVYELLSGHGWEEASNGYERLMSLWLSYRERFPQLDNYLFQWIFDFAQKHQLEFTIPELYDLKIPQQLEILNVLIDKYSNQKPLKLPFVLICSLCDYSITASKFYKDGNQQLMQQAIPRVVALADAKLQKETGKGLLATYGPKNATKRKHYVFQGAVCPDANTIIEFLVKGYTAGVKLRNYVNQLVRYSENVLRNLYGYRGRLRGVEVEAETAELIEQFLKKEYAPTKPEESNLPEKTEVKLNFKSIEVLRTQSNAVRKALEVSDEDLEQKELLTELPEVSAMFSALSESAKQLLNEFRIAGWESPVMEQKKILIAEINSAANRFIARSLIAIEHGYYIVEDDYRDELEYLYANNSKIASVDSNQITKEHNQKAIASSEQESGQGLKQFVDALTDVQKQALGAILFFNDPQEMLQQLAEESLSMPEILIDEINDVATQFLDDIIIDAFDDTPSVLEQYVEELKCIVQMEVK